MVGILAGMSPGPDSVLVIRNSVVSGFRVGAATTLGIGAALTIHITYTIIGFAIIIENNNTLFRIIQVIGASYLIWLASQAVRAGSPEKRGAGTPDLRGEGDYRLKQGFQNGFLCNILNPKATLFFLGVFSKFLHHTPHPIVKWIYGAEILTAVTVWFLFLSFLVASRRFYDFYQKWSYWVDRLFGIVLFYFGFKIIFDVISLVF
jgi:RhtB (resistance to homoserine/threonine) family protein